MKTYNYQVKRWILPKPINANEIADVNLNITLQKVLIRRGIDLNDQFDEYLYPSDLPNPEIHFTELRKASQRLIQACRREEHIAICGDYDADGITSTVLLFELLSILGAKVTTYIPSRQEQGYGLNTEMIDEIDKQQIKLIITVDNGISAIDAITKATNLGIDLIITDHHKIPDRQLEVYSLIHPERTPINSPYRFLAGVGIAYLLAKNICYKLNFDINSTTANVFYCIGTIADMAPLKGANRKWLKECLPKINKTNNIGFRAIMKKLKIDKIDITTDDIGFKIAPLINAVGRIGDPNLIIDLFTNESKDSVDRLIKDCFAMNFKRKRMTSLIEKEALDIAISEYENDRKFLVLVNKDWHPGIIGIVAARMVDKFNLPTALIAQANDGMYRGSIRSNNYLKVNKALEDCKDILVSYGGHSNAAGFTIKEENIELLEKRLDKIANHQFKNINIDKSIKPDAYLSFSDISVDFFTQLNSIGPFGVMNPSPIFWTRKCKIINIYNLKGGHLKMHLYDGNSSIEAIKWNASIKLNKNDIVDVAYLIEINNWKKTKTFQLNLLDIKIHNEVIDLKIHDRSYKCQITEQNNVLITNTKGEYITSDLYEASNCLNIKQKKFARKILSFAEIALGKAA